MIRVLAWLLGSTAGRYVAGGLAIALAVGFAAFRLWAYGRDALRAEIAAEGLRRLQHAIKEKDRIEGLSYDERARFVSRFLRPD